MEPKNVPKKDFYRVLKRLRDIRAWAIKRKIDPWAFRQALITVLELDTNGAIEHGVKAEKLETFDMVAREEAVKWLVEDEG
jgi:hypothetical protein